MTTTEPIFVKNNMVCPWSIVNLCYFIFDIFLPSMLTVVPLACFSKCCIVFTILLLLQLSELFCCRPASFFLRFISGIIQTLAFRYSSFLIILFSCISSRMSLFLTLYSFGYLHWSHFHYK